MKNRFWIFLFPCLSLTLPLFSQAGDTSVSRPEIRLSDYEVSGRDGQLIFSSPEAEGIAKVRINQEAVDLDFRAGQAAWPVEVSDYGRLYLIQQDNATTLHHVSGSSAEMRVRHLPMWLSVLPPLIAIILALIFREVVVSLFVGIWVGAFIAGGLRVDSIYHIVLSFLQVVEKYIISALNDAGHLSVIVFSLLIGGMVAIISRNGGMAGVVQSLSRYARTPRSAQAITWLLGVAIFFDDYANTLIVGNTMRSVTDRFRISREKLAYIVDSTAAPVAAVAFITTWIGAELGYIDDGIAPLRNFDFDMTAYAIFISSLKYSFYPVLTLIFILLLIFTRRDYGQMFQAEIRARTTGKVSSTSAVQGSEELEDLSPVEGAPIRWYNAFIPVIAVILMTIYGLIDTGFANTYRELLEGGITPASQSWGAIWSQMPILMGEDQSSFFLKIGKLIGNADSYVALLWSSLTGVLLAIILTLSKRIMSLPQTISTLIAGFKTMFPALLILTLAWSLATTTEELHTAVYLTMALQNTINPYFMPVIIFVLAAAISFSTGSSWSTMAILYPIAIPTTWAICRVQGLEAGVSLEILLNVISTVLAASVMGDHCSPISDTTILSSLASDCNHIDHVRTQLPYALTVGSVSITAGFLSTLFGGGWLVCTALLLASIALLGVIVLRIGRPVDD